MKNFRRSENEAICSRDFFDTTRRSRYAPQTASSLEFSISSAVELISPANVPFESYQSRPLLVSLASPLSAAPSMTPLTIGDSEAESTSTALAKELRTKDLDCMPLLVLVLILCLFITLSIWVTALIQNEVHDSHIDAVDDADVDIHFAKFGDLKPPVGLSNQETTKKPGLKITARTAKWTSTTLDDGDIATMTPRYRRVDDAEDDREQTPGAGGKYIDESVEACTSQTGDTTVIRPQRPAYSRRRLPHKKPDRRLPRRGQAKRLHRRRHVQQQSVPLSDYAEK
ncbi:uncharacterized protein LOC144123533 [Amblyomma americanum]